MTVPATFQLQRTSSPAEWHIAGTDLSVRLWKANGGYHFIPDTEPAQQWLAAHDLIGTYFPLRRDALAVLASCAAITPIPPAEHDSGPPATLQRAFPGVHVTEEGDYEVHRVEDPVMAATARWRIYEAITVAGEPRGKPLAVPGCVEGAETLRLAAVEITRLRRQARWRQSLEEGRAATRSRPVTAKGEVIFNVTDRTFTMEEQR